MEEDYYAPWEWQPIERMPDGCSDVDIKTVDGEVTDMCSCDFWWLSDERKSKYVSFRFRD